MLVGAGAIKFGEFTLKSGRKSDYYVDKYAFATDPRCLAYIGSHIAHRLPFDVDLLAGIEIGSIPLATAASLHSGNPYLIVRKAKKGYGTNKLIEGTYEQGQKVFLVEDVVTTGSSAIDAMHVLRNAGLIVDDVICVVDREEGGCQALESRGVRVQSLVTASELKERA